MVHGYFGTAMLLKSVPKVLKDKLGIMAMNGVNVNPHLKLRYRSSWYHCGSWRSNEVQDAIVSFLDSR